MSEAADSTQSTTRRKATSKTRGGAPGQRGASATTAAPNLDDETAAALTLYNTYLAADRAQQAHERALRKAEKAKDEAAAAVRKLNDRKAPSSEMAAAEAQYHDTVEALRRLRDGDTAAPEDEDDEGGDDTAAATSDDDAPDETDDTTSDETEDTAPDETEAATEQADDTTSDETEAATEQADDTTSDEAEAATEQADDTTSENADETPSVGVEASVSDDDLAGDEPAGVAG